MPENKKKPATGLPLPVPSPKIVNTDAAKIAKSEAKLAAARDLISGIRDVAGIGGDVGLRSFTKGFGVDFKISNNQIVAQVRSKEDNGFYIDGKPVADPETTELLRGVLRSELSSQGKQGKKMKKQEQKTQQ